MTNDKIVIVSYTRQEFNELIQADAQKRKLIPLDKQITPGGKIGMYIGEEQIQFSVPVKSKT